MKISGEFLIFSSVFKNKYISFKIQSYDYDLLLGFQKQFFSLVDFEFQYRRQRNAYIQHRRDNRSNTVSVRLLFVFSWYAQMTLCTGCFFLFYRSIFIFCIKHQEFFSFFVIVCLSPDINHYKAIFKSPVFVNFLEIATSIHDTKQKVYMDVVEHLEMGERKMLMTRYLIETR